METFMKSSVAAEYLKLPEGTNAQLIEGEIIEMTSPATPHQKLLVNLCILIGDYVEKMNLGTLLIAPTDVFLNEQNIYQPDLFFIAKERESIIKENGIHGSPDLIIEILSPSTAYYDTKKKFMNYKEAGVKEYWIIDPFDKEAIGYTLREKSYNEFYRAIGKFESKILNFQFSFS